MAKSVGYDVDYSVLDAYKHEAMAAAAQTAANLLKVGFEEVKGSRGGSAYLIKGRGMILAFVVEGLGTLNLVAEEVLKLTGNSYMAQVQRANFATILNDLTASGAQPLIANSFMAVGSEDYFKNPAARADSIRGWQEGCLEVGCAWGGGETQKARDILEPGTALLAGAAIGIIKPITQRWIRGNIRHGDAIVVVHSSGIHANGLTMARDVRSKLASGYQHQLPNGQTFGEALLKALHVLYGPLTQRLLDNRVEIHYISNITGHGWRKIMRLDKKFTYSITKLPQPHPVFLFIQERTGASNRQMYETFNMGGGAAYIIPEASVRAVLDTAAHLGLKAEVAGKVTNGPRRVILTPIGETFASEDYPAP